MKTIITKNYICWLCLSIAVMSLLPFIAVTFVKGDAGMAVCFLLFYAVNPIYSIVVGFFTSKNIKKMWSLPILSSILFLLSAWIFFDISETAFVVYAIIYFVISIIIMFISAFIKKKIQR